MSKQISKITIGNLYEKILIDSNFNKINCGTYELIESK